MRSLTLRTLAVLAALLIVCWFPTSAKAEPVPVAFLVCDGSGTGLPGVPVTVAGGTLFTDIDGMVVFYLDPGFYMAVINYWNSILFQAGNRSDVPVVVHLDTGKE